MAEDQAPDPPDPSGLMRDWATLWSSEFAALAADREWLEWIGALRPDGAGEPPGSAWAAPPAGSAPAAAASDARDDEAIAGLRRCEARIAELERRLAELAGSGSDPGRR